MTRTSIALAAIAVAAIAGSAFGRFPADAAASIATAVVGAVAGLNIPKRHDG